MRVPILSASRGGAARRVGLTTVKESRPKAASQSNAAHNAGFDVPATKPMPANPRSIIADVDGSGPAASASQASPPPVLGPMEVLKIGLVVFMTHLAVDLTKTGQLIDDVAVEQAQDDEAEDDYQNHLFD
jgi:hypothetical protein